MSENEINWSDLHRNATTVLEGEFPVVITEAAVAAAASSGKPMIKCKVRVESGTYLSRTILHNFNITADNDNAMRIFFTHMSVLGLDEKFWRSNSGASVEQIAQALVGKRATAVIGSREWQGSLREEIKGWKPAAGGPGSFATGGALGGLVAPTTSAAGNPTARFPAGPTPGSAPATPTVAETTTPPPEDPF